MHTSAAAQLKKNKANIKIIWEKKVRENVRSAENQTSIALLNSIEIFLDELIAVLAQPDVAHPSDVGKKGMSKMHGEQRAKFVGYYLPQLLKEFSILREVIIDDLHKSNILNYEVGMIVNNSIDSAISLAATKFTAVQQKAIKVALEKAETSNKELEQFAAVAAHDLKSPLASISGYLDLLTDDVDVRPNAGKYIHIMQKASERMRNLVDRLLDYARLMKTDRPFRAVDLNEVMKSVLQNLNDAIQKTGAIINCEHLPTVNGDADLLTQVFQNLIANSLKFYAGRFPTVAVKCGFQNDMFLFSVTDNGIGFDPKDKKGIFAIYKKLQGDSRYQGAGIGLATCKKVVDLHGGTIWAESKPGLGSTFYFTLPNPAVAKSGAHH